MKLNKDLSITLLLDGVKLKFKITDIYRGIPMNYRNDSTLKNGIYFIPWDTLNPQFQYLENLEWFSIDKNNKLTFIGYTSDFKEG